MEGREKWKKWFRRDNLLILILSGVLLFILALPTKEGSRKTKEKADDERPGGTGLHPKPDLLWQ